MPFQHQELAAGRWQMLTLAEQLGNIGSEVHRAVSAEGKNGADFRNAFVRALELFDLTLADPRHRSRLKEIARVREIFCDAASDHASYNTTLRDIDTYLVQFALVARRNR